MNPTWHREERSGGNQRSLANSSRLRGKAVVNAELEWRFGEDLVNGDGDSSLLCVKGKGVLCSRETSVIS